jgi:hypothetical protein
MARSQPYTVACSGGLNKSANSIDLLRTPGAATVLQNFEVATEGGYRRINGFYKFGEGSATQPTGGTSEIFGVMPYADGVVAVVGNALYFSQDGITWLQINKISSGTGDNYTTFTGLSASVRTGQGQATFALFESSGMDYGEIFIADNSTKDIFSFRMEGTGALNTRTFFAKEIQPNGANTPIKYITSHDHHLIAAGLDGEETTIYYSVYNNPNNFTGVGAGSVSISDEIVGIRGFREDLIVFCENSLHKLVNINDSANIRIDPIAENVGCLSGYSIQEIGGDLVFLAPDGIRTVAGTARIGDVELGTVSKPIQPIINELARNINDYVITSMVHRDKSQYRLFYTNRGAAESAQRGIIGTLRPDGFQWSEIQGIEVTAIGTAFNEVGVEEHYHGSQTGYVYVHDAGDDFDGSNIDARYQTPDYDYGDFGTLKTLHYIKMSIGPDNEVQPTLRVRFDYDSNETPQPNDIVLDSVPAPAKFGTAIFATAKFGAAEQPLVRIPLVGSGYSNSFRVLSDDTNAPYTINGFYVDYIPSGRR